MNWPIPTSTTIEISKVDTTCEMLWAVAQGAHVSLNPTIIPSMNANADLIPEES